MTQPTAHNGKTDAADAGLSLVIGADGLIGSALYRTLISQGQQVVGTTRRAGSSDLLLLDLAQPPEAWPTLPADIRTAYLCAGVASIEYCRLHPQLSRQVNCAGSIALARRLTTQGTRVVYLSSNQVFDGQKPMRHADEPVCPLTEYGKQKAITEGALLELGELASIARLTKVLGPQPALLMGWKQALEAGQAITPFHDMHMAPVSLELVVEALLRIGSQQASGITQISGSQDITYTQAAHHLARRLGCDASLITPMSARAAGLHPHATPMHTTMDDQSLRRLGLQAPDPWQTLDHVMQLPNGDD